ncbi:MAG: SDR family oxidoreductase [Acetivibrionales bacterium]|jgi:3-oxoacyl-[acyl-carrier protein] reductase|nr:SDR family oxidoreductase [Bacillota bacterium]NLP08689.1 SDR family oxidoreductase [Clostridiaceae bacterium]HOA56054.1 SDR family oxidoreductase [Clostridiales bacterium]HPZ05420.1 SDR family oxidoreductase [Clostridiales bacterium]HQD32120.1 SDR family oxidoreductase [Clostridiales bacterium]
MISVKGKWAFITGAARGIGYLTAIFLAERGCNLVLHSRSKEHTKKVLSEVRALGVEAYDVEAELTDVAAIERMLDEIEEKGTQIDIVLNNAGLQPGYRTDYFSTPVSDFTVSFMVNTIAPAMICYRFLPKMIERGFGRIVNTTSGIRNEPEQAGYSAAKAALDKFTTDLATTVDGTDVIISLTDPGWCRTDMGGRHAPNSPESAIPGVCVGVFVNDRKSGRCFSAQEFTGMTLEEAVRKAEQDA